MAVKEDVKEEVQQEESTEKETPQEESTSTAESNTETLSNLTPDQYKEWRTSGKLPEKVEKPKTEESKKPEKKDEPSEEDVEEEEEETPKPSKKVSRSEARRAELNEEIRTLATKRQEEEKALNDILEKKKKASEPEKKEPEKEEQPKTISLKDLVAKVKARADKGEFASYEEVVAATAETLIEERGVISESKLQKMLSDAMEKFKTDWVKEQKDAQDKNTVEAQRKAQETEWVKKVNDAEKKHPDYKAVCFAKDSPAARIKSGSPLDRAILKHPQGAELLYHVCSVDGEVERINALDPDLDQPSEIKDIIAKFSEEPKEKSDEAPPPPTTRAKKPPTEATGRSSATADESEAALKNKDVAAYMRAENAKEQARRKAQLGLK